MSLQNRVHDPLFHFETHFPERLSRLHLSPEFGAASPSRRCKRSRGSRQGIRYKTQPITFDEITEVDEDNTPAEENSKDQFQQLQAFSRSMDGLIPKVPSQGKAPTGISEGVTNLARPASISEVPLDMNNKENTNAENRLQEGSQHGDSDNCLNRNNFTCKDEKGDASDARNVVPHGLSALPPTGLRSSADGRQKKMTAKAKRRQMLEKGKDDAKDS